MTPQREAEIRTSVARANDPISNVFREVLAEIDTLRVKLAESQMRRAALEKLVQAQSAPNTEE